MSIVVCHYCLKPPVLVSGDVIYPHRPDLATKKIWLCAGCDAYVGTHVGTEQPLGRLANAELRQLKVAAHAAFDPLWKAKIKRDGCSKGEARGAGYKWLAKQLGIDAADCHIGMFDEAMCKRVIEVIKNRKVKAMGDGK